MQKEYSIEGIFDFEMEWFLKEIQPICDLISLYNGPILKQHFDVNSLSFIGSKNNFSFNFKCDEQGLEFNYFETGEKRVQLTISNNKFNFNLFKSYSEPITNEIVNRIEEIVDSIKSIVKAPTKTESNSQIEIDEKIEIHIKIANNSNFDKRYIQLMNEVCQMITSNDCPVFSENDLVYKVSESSFETFYRLNIQSGIYEINYLNYEFDTGHWSGSKGGSIDFSFSKNNKELLKSEIKTRRIIIYLDSSLANFENQIEQKVLAHFSN